MENKKHIDMEVKKSEKASLENKRLLFTEIGFVVALIAIYFAFNWSSTEKRLQPSRLK